jgi:hypothetical protein
VFREYIPPDLDDGILYISMDYATAVHLCACGCRSKVVTPFSPADWQLAFDGTVTLRPSIGNGQLPCRSHYYIHQDHIHWVRKMSASATNEASQRDQAALRYLHTRDAARPSWWRRCATRVRAIIGLG